MNRDEAKQAKEAKHIYHTVFNVAEVFIYPDPFTLSEFTTPLAHEAMQEVLERLKDEGYPVTTIERVSRLAIADSIADGIIGRVLREGYEPNA